MHEASVTGAVIEQARTFVPGGMRLALCRLEVGELEHLDPEVMSQMWRAMTDGTEMEGAALEIERVALRVRCGSCAEAFEPEDRAVLRCPHCGSVRPEILEGTGVVLKSLEVEEEA